MPEQARPISELVKRFQRGPEWDRITNIGSIAIKVPGDNSMGVFDGCRAGFDYAVSTYPLVYGYRDFTMHVKAPGGVMGGSPPTGVEFSRSSDVITLNNVNENVDGADVSVTATALPHVSPESLLLPGDPGFELVDQAHTALASLNEPVEQVVCEFSAGRKVVPSAAPNGFQCISAKNVLTQQAGQLGYETVAYYGMNVLDESIRFKLRLGGEPDGYAEPGAVRASDMILEGRVQIADPYSVRAFDLNDRQLSVAANLHQRVLALYQ